jgi:hypothetical protein
LCAVVIACAAFPIAASAAGDVGFASRHPRLFFSTSELPALRARVHDGGVDDAAYAYIRNRAVTVYTTQPLDTLVSDDAAQEQIINLALASHFEASVDSQLVNLGRRLTLYIVRKWDRDTDPFGTSLRLRAMAIGFDHFFVNATPAERQEVRDRAYRYMYYMEVNLNYDIWRHRPYTSNKTAMVSAALGLASIAFQDELPAADTDAARAAADDFYHAWRDTQLSTDGCYREGTLYAGWSTRNLIYYFAARKRFDGVDYGTDPAIRAIERWFPYELDTRGDARVNNIQDQTDYYRPFARHSTYWAWAQSEWGSHLAAYMWDHSAGPYGRDMLDENDKAATVLWHQNLAPVNPGTMLPRSHVWEDRGLYYFRTGWPDGGTSGDVVFSFYSGEFRGGHAQEDQNQFTLSAYGEKLVLDNGAGSTAKQSEAHNIIRIDGNGEHNAGSSIGTDGKITEFVTSDYADVVRGDATLAYSTYSPYNDAGVPYPWSNWSWGYSGANPVEHALRTVVAVHGNSVPPYFVIRDDIQKDESSHMYDWCMHAPANAAIDTTSGLVTVSTALASLRLYSLAPERAALAATFAPFDNQNEDPNTQLIMMSDRAIDPHFTFLLLPLPAQGAAPVVTRTALPNGARLTVDWGSALVDEIRMRMPYSPGGVGATDPGVFPGNILTDAEVSVVRSAGPTITGYTLVGATYLSAAGITIAAIDDAPASLVFDGSSVHLGRADADFRLLASMVSSVDYHGQPVPVHVEGNYLVRTVTTGVGDPAPRRLYLRTYPNPFNPQVQISFVNPARGVVTATVHDIAGRRVATLVSRVMEAGSRTLVWNGEDEAGNPSASGVYFLRLRAGALSATTKLVLVR